MTSKEALEILFASYNYNGNYQEVIEAREKLEQDLERLEKLEKIMEGIKKYPTIINESVRFDSVRGVLMMLPVSTEQETKEIKDIYYSISEVLKNEQNS